MSIKQKRHIRYGLLPVWLLLLPMMLFSACKSPFELKNVDYSMLLETVAIPDPNGKINDDAYGVVFNVKPLQFLEKGDSSAVNSEYRLIRDISGYYFVTSKGYRHVYIFKPGVQSLVLHKKVNVSVNGLTNPAFNQRKPEIHLLEADTLAYKIHKDGIVGAKK